MIALGPAALLASALAGGVPVVCAPAAPTPAAIVRQAAGHFEADRLERAEACFQRALDEAVQAADVRTEAEARRGLGRVLLRLGRPAEAARELHRALALYAGLDDAVGVARTHSHLGSLAVQQGDALLARELYEDARATFRAGGAAFATDAALVLYNLLFVTPGSAERARLIEEGLALAGQAGNPTTEGRLLSAWGDMATDAGDYTGADQRYRRARTALAAGTSREALGRLLTSMARLQLAHGDPARALGLGEEALAVQDGIGDVRGAVQTLNLLGTAASRLGRHRAAARSFARALDLARQRKDERLMKVLPVRLAEATLASGRPARAAALLEAALTPPVDPEVESGAHELLARAYVSLARPQDALAAADRALAAARAGNKPRFDALRTRARGLQALGRSEEALADVREAIALVEDMRGRLIPSDFLKQGFGERHQALYGLAIDLLHGLGRHAEALEAAEQGRARAFLDLLATRRQDEAAGQALASTRTAAPMNAAEAAATAARLGSNVLAYWVGPEATVIWVVSPAGEVRSTRTAIAAARLGALVKATASAAERWRMGEAPDRKPWRALHRALVQPVESWLPRAPGSRLTVVPHGPLFRLSFAALRDAEGRYLVERHALHYVPAMATLRFAAEARAAAAAAPPSYLLVADPSRLPAAPGVAALPALPAARREVRAVARLVAPSPATVLVGAKATEAAVRGAAGTATVLHLATHGVVRDDEPLSSFLALGRGGEGAEDDGRLTAADAYALRLRADLVFLSSCRSARGPVTGDGILGLSRAFLSAGTASLAATLWDVADAAAAELVPSFYAGLRKGADKSGALRDAQLRLLRRLRRGGVTVAVDGGAVALPEDPALWAGYILIGEP